MQRREHAIGVHLLQVNLVPIFLPIIRAVDARRAIWRVEANTLSRCETPSSDTEYTTGLVRENKISLRGVSTVERLESRKRCPQHRKRQTRHASSARRG